MQNNDIIVSIKFVYQPGYSPSEKKKTIQRFPLIENESGIELQERIYNWLGEKGYERKDICNLRLVYEGNI